MSTPLPLLVPPPALSFKAIAGFYAPLEDAITLAFPAVRFPDGSVMTADDLVAAQALLTRFLTATSPPDVWEPQLKIWRPAAIVDLTHAAGVPLSPPKTAAAPWQGIFTGSGQSDASGAPLLQPATGHFPQYLLRGVFRAQRAGHDAFGLGPESASIEFASAIGAAPFGADLTPDAAGATRVRIRLRTGAAQPAGVLEIDASGGNTVITLENYTAGGAALASVALLADGAIRLRPAAGRKVIVDGDFEAEHIRYLPVNGPRQDLRQT